MDKDLDDRLNRLKNLPPDVVERIKAGRAKAQAEIEQMNEEFARKFKLRDSVSGVYRTPSGLIDPNSGIIFIRKFQNDYGDTVYVRSVNNEAIPSGDQIAALSDRIKIQQADFDSLDPSEQSRIRTNFTSGDRTDSRFNNYLANEALAQQFQKLK